MEKTKLSEALNESNTKFWGIVVYEQVGDGCLNGSWTNTIHCGNNKRMNEIARKRENQDSGLVGNYIVSYIEPTDEAFTGNLIINQVNGIYNLRWEINESSIIFEGTGMQTGDSQLTAIFWQL